MNESKVRRGHRLMGWHKEKPGKRISKTCVRKLHGQCYAVDCECKCHEEIPK